MGVNKYRLQKEEAIDVLVVDNTKVREQQVGQIIPKVFLFSFYKFLQIQQFGQKVFKARVGRFLGFIFFSFLFQVEKLKRIKETRNEDEVSSFHGISCTRIQLQCVLYHLRTLVRVSNSLTSSLGGRPL